ncbi:MAG: HAD-IIA family hydrolase [Burkholderiales bacterium]|nr:HAD-IIA family hydrolase [Burkholderiales bacterium]
MNECMQAAADLPASIEACVIDLDGTLTVGEGLTRGAAELLAATRGAFVVLSNNSSHSPAGLADELARLGLRVAAERIVLAGAETVRLLAAEQPGARVMLIASPVLERLATHAGLVSIDEQPDFVVLARDERFSYERLARAANALRRGAQLIAANADLTHPGPDGTIVPETGALFAALRACCPDIACRVIGKPEPCLFMQALRILGTRPERTLVIGDNPATDGLGAKRSGMPFLRVRDCDVTDTAAWVRAHIHPAGAAR